MASRLPSTRIFTADRGNHDHDRYVEAPLIAKSDERVAVRRGLPGSSVSNLGEEANPKGGQL
jgi:hypothetical protein